MSLHSLLIKLIWVCIGPMILIAAYLAIDSVATQQADRDLHAANLAVNVAESIDQHLKARIGALQMLAGSSLLDNTSRHQDLYQEAQGFFRSFGSHVVFADAEMHMLFNTRVPFGTKLPMLPRPKGHAAAPAAMATGQPVVGDIFPGPIAREPLVAIAVPALREGKAVFLLLTVLETRRFRDHLDQAALPAGWSLALIDGNREVIARRAPQGLNPLEDVDAPGRFTARSAVAPWSVAIEIPRDVYHQPLLEAAFMLAIAILAATLISVLGGMTVARRLGRAVTSLTALPAPGTPPPDITEIALARRLLDESAEKHAAAEAARHESEQRYRLIAEQTADVIWLLDAASGRFTYVSPSIERLRGFKPHEIIGQTLEQVLPSDNYALLSETLYERIAGFEAGDESLRTYIREINQFRKDGSVIAAEVATTLITDDQGKVTTILAVSRDITERKKVENRLRESEEKYRIVADFTYDWEYWLDIHGRFRFLSPSVERITGYSPSAFQNDRDLLDKILPPGDRAHLAGHLQNARDGNPDHDFLEFRIVTKDGQERWLSHVCVPVYLDDGTYAGRRGSNRDITASKRIEKEKTKLQEQLLHAQKMESIGRLAGGVAHDFNNKLSVIIGFTEIVLDESDPELPIHGHLQEIKKAADQSTDLTRQLLAFARKQTISPKMLDLNETIEGMLKMLRRLIGEDIVLTWLPGSNLGPVWIDPSQIDQLLVNLCVNARDAINGVGIITIESRNVEFDDTYCSGHVGFRPGDYVLIAVSDNGCGMDKETLNRLFEPFFTTKEIGKGTGLGLATVYGIVGQNRGFINVYSEPGQGTTFRIYLPRHTGETEPARVPEKSETIAQGHETILVVEDAAEILNMIHIMLEKQGYRVLAAKGPSEAIRLAETYDGEIHLVITDVVMPVMNGRDLIRRLILLHPNLKYFFMSGYTANVIAHQGILDEGIRFLQKPFSKKDLSLMVRETLDRK